MVQRSKERLFEIDSKKLELDSLQRRFIIECKRFVASTVEEKIRSAISLNNEKVLALGRQGLMPVKKQVDQIIDNISNSVELTLNSDELWLHTRTELRSDNFHNGEYKMKDGHVPEIFKDAVKKLLSPIGKLLIQYDLDGYENWEEKNNYLYYRHHVDWSREMKECMEQYEEQLNELSGLIKVYEDLSRDTGENDALELWDSL